MDYLKYFKNDKYTKGINDCWTLIQDIFRDEKGIELPNCPIMTDYSPFVTKLKSNLDYKIISEPKEGCLVFYMNGDIVHIGYALNDKKYIHKTYSCVQVSDIPKKAIIYEVIGVK